ncbi:MAG: hypothetical protein K2X93_16470 [Candidatus Obscuribacterales bacterium]|nr:hypothetical protein [Candidatus Obscuribacterales bacterium]
MSESTARNVEFINNWNGAAPTDITNKFFEDIMDDFDMETSSDDDSAIALHDETESDEQFTCLDDGGKLKEMKEKVKPPLTRLEAHVLRGLAHALSAADGEKVEEMLGILAEHPGSIRRVLEELKHIKEASDDLKTLNVSWEQGTDRNNQQFVRLIMRRNESKSSNVQVVIGSDGRNQAVRIQSGGNPENLSMSTGLEAVRPIEAMRQLSVKQELLREATERGRRP